VCDHSLCLLCLFVSEVGEVYKHATTAETYNLILFCFKFFVKLILIHIKTNTLYMHKESEFNRKTHI